ncbi:MAG: hypothetical protein KDA45_07020 [Planctomycetales bacterium]|nr:hypothetical protein [Planctomycetales bacterium]
MNRPSWLQKTYWSHFAKPVAERKLFTQLVDRPIRSLLEVGLGDGQRMRRIAKLVQLPSDTASLRYIGTDEFESAKDTQGHMSLKQAHKLATQLGFKASLIPGDVASALPRVAHKFGTSDLVIIDGGLDPAQPLSSFCGSWLNRVAHSDSVVLACEQPGGTLQIVDCQQLQLPQLVAA